MVVKDSFPFDSKSIVVPDLLEFEANGVLPFTITCKLVKLKGFSIVLRNLVTILVLDSPLNLSDPIHVDSPDKEFGSLSELTETFPTRFIKQVMFCSILSAGDWVIPSYDTGSPVWGGSGHSRAFPLTFLVRPGKQL